MALNTTLLRAALDRCADPEVDWEQETYLRCFAAQVCIAAGYKKVNEDGWYGEWRIPGREDGLFTPWAAQFALTGDKGDRRFRTSHCQKGSVCQCAGCREMDLFDGVRTLPELIRIVNALDPEGAAFAAAAAPQYDQDRFAVTVAA